MNSGEDKQIYSGNCHCGAVQFKVTTHVQELTTCNCSICKRKNAQMFKVHENELELLAGAESLTEYQFHTKTARHFFCKICGIYPFHRKRVTPDYFGINVSCLTDFHADGLAIRETNGSEME